MFYEWFAHLLDQSYKIGLLRQFYSMSSHAEIIRSDAFKTLYLMEM